LTLYLTNLTGTTHVLHENKTIIIIICQIKNPQNTNVGLMNFAQKSLLERTDVHIVHL